MARTFGARCRIAGSSRAGKAKTHGDNAKFCGVVENIFGNAQPCPQPPTAGIIKRAAFGMRNPARGLSNNQYARSGRRLNDWFWPKWQIIAKRTFANLVDQLVNKVSRVRQLSGARF